MVQHQTDSSADNVTPSVQSWFHEEAAAERRAQLPGRAVWSCAPTTAKHGGHIYGDLGGLGGDLSLRN